MLRSALPSLLLFTLKAGALAEEGALEFNRDIRPLLSDRCFTCHGPDAAARKGELRLDTPEAAFEKRESGAAIIPGKPAESLIWQRILSKDPDEVMPPPDSHLSLSLPEREMIRRWIEGGAVYQPHWTLQRVERPAIPKDGGNPIDSLVSTCIAKEGLTLSPEAEKETLIRRVSLDLRGLPPTPEETAAFLADPAPDAYERIVDRFLADPAYGERMTWPWLDAARYADSNGFQNDLDRTMWPWRDWVISAFNRNLSYDQFTIWQLAGDLLLDATPEQILATGFLRNHAINGEGGSIPEENRVNYTMDMSETTGTVWMGLTLNCCRCHDHKYDPLTQRDYYQFLDFFNQTPVDGSGGNPQTPPVLEMPSETQKQELAAATRQAAELDRQLAAKKSSPPTEALSKEPAARTAEEKKLIREAYEMTDAELVKWTAEKKALDARIKGLKSAIPKVMVMADRKERRIGHILSVGSYDKPLEPVTVNTPAVLPPLAKREDVPDRLDLARWLVSRDHPLTARVTVNRFWQDLFGIGLIKTPENFGMQSELPVHQELLDWLAAEFMESGWDVKHLLRLIVTSRTYRQSSRVTAAALEKDPANRLLARGPRFRLPAWMLRDQTLADSGALRRTIGGPPVKPYQPESLWPEATFGKVKYVRDKGDALYRRSLYTFWRRISAPPMFFDNARRDICSVNPARTNTPLHALAMLNDTTYVEAARLLASRAAKEAGADPAARLNRAFQIVLSRLPTKDESAILNDSLQQARQSFTADPASAQAFLKNGDSLPDPAMEPVEQAALASVCLSILNLDEALTKE